MSNPPTNRPRPRKAGTVKGQVLLVLTGVLVLAGLAFAVKKNAGFKSELATEVALASKAGLIVTEHDPNPLPPSNSSFQQAEALWQAEVRYHADHNPTPPLKLGSASFAAPKPPTESLNATSDAIQQKLAMHEDSLKMFEALAGRPETHLGAMDVLLAQRQLSSLNGATSLFMSKSILDARRGKWVDAQSDADAALRLAHLFLESPRNPGFAGINATTTCLQSAAELLKEHPQDPAAWGFIDHVTQAVHPISCATGFDTGVAYEILHDNLQGLKGEMISNPAKLAVQTGNVIDATKAVLLRYNRLAWGALKRSGVDYPAAVRALDQVNQAEAVELQHRPEVILSVQDVSGYQILPIWEARTESIRRGLQLAVRLAKAHATIGQWPTTIPDIPVDALTLAPLHWTVQQGHARLVIPHHDPQSILTPGAAPQPVQLSGQHPDPDLDLTL